MFKSAAGKVMWVGRATVFLVGLAVILALVFGVASTALGKNGQSLILGKGNNVATKVTGLIGKVATGSALVVKNPKGGSALDLQVGNAAATPPIPPDTVAPMKVNSNAKVENLNSDHLDGQSASAFLRLGQNVVTVAPSGAEFTSIAAALESIADASATNRYVVLVAPGTYEGAFAMKPFVDIQGAGELLTTITSCGGATSTIFESTPTVLGADNAGLRYLTVENLGNTSPCSSAETKAVAMRVKNASTLLDHVTLKALATGTERANIGFMAGGASSPSLIDVTADLSGSSSTGTGVANFGSGTVTVKHSKVGGFPALVMSGVTGAKLQVAASQIIGTTQTYAGELKCVVSYDGNYDPRSCA